MPATDLIRLVDASKVYPGGAVALSSVTLSVAEGEIFGVIGESGAGKSTLLGLLTGQVRPSAGEVRVLGRDVPLLDRSALRAYRREVGVVFQSVPLLANRTVRQNIAAPLLLAGRRVDRAGVRRAVDEVLGFVGLAHRGDDFPAQLSGGQRQRVGIARALVTRPRLLVCDEPTSSLDASTAAGVLALLSGARERFGTTVVVVTHDLDVVTAICDRVGLFDDGSLVEVLPVPRRATSTDGTYLDRVRRSLGA